ncbi:hypothetical protein CASFOL_000811 [Castilleja foliolosa]|uniref:Valyl-tRNA synthetase tRNA-binding arm domain-containing protein n=1 Tax=Castilleja foliolosa TaxID=1961234 RepID=A0ABD3ELA2_9LAMI
MLWQSKHIGFYGSKMVNFSFLGVIRIPRREQFGIHEQSTLLSQQGVYPSIVANSDVIQYLSKEREVLALLSRLDLQNNNFLRIYSSDANQSVHLFVSEGLEAYLPLADMVDISAEVHRLSNSKRLTKTHTEYDRLMARLSSPGFVEKAPENIVDGV